MSSALLAEHREALTSRWLTAEALTVGAGEAHLLTMRVVIEGAASEATRVGAQSLSDAIGSDVALRRRVGAEAAIDIQSRNGTRDVPRVVVDAGKKHTHP